MVWRVCQAVSLIIAVRLRRAWNVGPPARAASSVRGGPSAGCRHNVALIQISAPALRGRKRGRRDAAVATVIRNQHGVTSYSQDGVGNHVTEVSEQTWAQSHAHDRLPAFEGASRIGKVVATAGTGARVTAVAP